jgi:hypothetical protein
MQHDVCLHLAASAGGDDACADKLTKFNQAVHGLLGLSKALQLRLEGAEDVEGAAKVVTALDKEAMLAAEGCPMQVRAALRCAMLCCAALRPVRCVLCAYYC